MFFLLLFFLFFFNLAKCQIIKATLHYLFESRIWCASCLQWLACRDCVGSIWWQISCLCDLVYWLTSLLSSSPIPRCNGCHLDQHLLTFFHHLEEGNENCAEKINYLPKLNIITFSDFKLYWRIRKTLGIGINLVIWSIWCKIKKNISNV